MNRRFHQNLRFLQEELGERDSSFLYPYSFSLYKDNQTIAKIFYREIENSIVISILFADMDIRSQLEAFYYIEEEIIRKFHPQHIMIKEYAGIKREVLKNCQYKDNDGLLCKRVDSYRLKISDRVFDEQGYIIHQGLMKDVIFGWLGSHRNGCGWIAAYNLLKYLGHEQSMQTIIQELNRFTVTSKVSHQILGQEVIELFYWLKHIGLPVKMKVGKKEKCAKIIQESTCGILLYNIKWMNHYTFFKRVDREHTQFYNAIYGRRMHIVRASDFLKEKAFLPVAIVIYIEKI